MSFGERMQAVLDERGMTRADLCRATGLTSGHLTPYMKDPDRSPNLSTAVKIASALDVSIDYLAGITDDPTPRHATAPALAPSERELLGDYRSLDPPGRDTARAQVRLLAELQAKSAARASPSSAAGAAEPA